MTKLYSLHKLIISVTAARGYPSSRITRNATIYSDELEEILNLHHLLEGYNSILYRYHGNPDEKFQNWNYDTRSDFKRPDRQIIKYTEEEAIEQMNNVDEIFPIYGKYFNISDANYTDSFEDVLNERIDNIEQTIMHVKKEVVGDSVGRIGMKLQTLMSLVFIANTLNLLC